MASDLSDLEREFDSLWAMLRGPALLPEYKFHPARRWRFDRVWVERKLAIEIEGGAWSGGRHTRGSGFIGDCEKYNQAAVLGWTVYRLAGKMISFGYVSALLTAIRTGEPIQYTFPRKSRRGKSKIKMLMEASKCNSHRRSASAPNSNSP